VILLGIDTETTGLKVATASIVEIGMVLWDTDLHSPVKLLGNLVDPGPDAAWEPGASESNGLSYEICAKYGITEAAALKQVISWFDKADTVVAHNGFGFDFPLLEHWAKRHNLPLPSKFRIDTKCDLEISSRNSTRLIYMAADHGFLNPFSHRAVFDALTMLKILDCYNIDQVVETAKSPVLTIRALVSYNDREKAKARGYHWQAESKMWTMIVRERYLERERAAAREVGFDIEVISEE
jgi:DNA polymerase-3 subunit epsilon